MKQRTYSPLDQLAMNMDQALRTVFGRPQVTERENPTRDSANVELDEAERQHVAGLMRINHVGEVCAQAL